MLRGAASNVLWLAKAAALFWGAVLTLALVFGVATMALAAVPGDPFRLGQVNTINALTRLVGNVNVAMLRIDNNSTGPSATALDLRVEEDRAPMVVNSDRRVANLNADKLDNLEPSQIKGAKAYALVDPNEGPGGTPALLPNRTSGFTSVERTGPGDYCLKAPGLSPQNRPAEVSVEWYTTFPPEANAAAMFNSRNVCPNGQFAVRTERTVLSESALRDADADDVGFVIAVP